MPPFRIRQADAAPNEMKRPNEKAAFQAAFSLGRVCRGYCCFAASSALLLMVTG